MKASLQFALYLTILPSFTVAVKWTTSTPVMFFTVFAADSTASFAASSQLLSDMPITSIIFTTILNTLQNDFLAKQ